MTLGNVHFFAQMTMHINIYLYLRKLNMQMQAHINLAKNEK